jgi:hypothetical protein
MPLLLWRTNVIILRIKFTLITPIRTFNLLFLSTESLCGGERAAEPTAPECAGRETATWSQLPRNKGACPPFYNDSYAGLID